MYIKWIGISARKRFVCLVWHTGVLYCVAEVKCTLHSGGVIGGGGVTVNNQKQNNSKVNIELAIAIVEDDMLQAHELRSMVSEYESASRTLFRFDLKIYSTLQDFKEQLDEGCFFDIVVMDIDFGPDAPTGIDAVSHWFPAGCGTQIIYVSGYSKFCSLVYRTEYAYFLLKPFTQKSFHEAFSKAVLQVRSYRQRTLAIRTRGSVVAIPVESITHIESNKRKVLIHTLDSDVEAYASIVELLGALPDNFVQCHKSFVVNMAHIRVLNTGEALLVSGVSIPISQKRRKAVQESFMVYARELISARSK